MILVDNDKRSYNYAIIYNIFNIETTMIIS